ncbi:GNAT family N-acetyltransferase [Arthrobacter zhaoguopingii]|uniref:GNAT family N-acetyltransferase n=1 Tax=Arthrobacter zhaoguopingii TaxID=2681491 RepID=UPI001356B36E|nr:GNAT family protein [Arthrobacter zhaoguopingii]
MAFTPLTLTGSRVVLEPLAHRHYQGLVDAVRDGELWKLWYTSIPSPEGMAEEIDRRLARQAEGEMLPFATLDAQTGAVLGMTTFCDIDRATPRVEIGYTWNRLSTQRTGTNAESKLLMLTHAFETEGCASVTFTTHWHNLQSREAITRLGARQDGVLRAHSRMADGTLRDTVVFSITAPEWPAVASGLRHRLERAS